MVADQGMVSPGPGDAGGSPHSVAVEARVAHEPRGRIPPFPKESPASRLETQRESLEAEGLSAAAAATIGQGLRQSTKNQYNRKWSYFVRWCKGRNLHPLHCSVREILDYLENLAAAGLKFNTIALHVSALSACLPLLDRNPVGTAPLVTKWLRGFKAKNPPRRLIVPPWDLTVVLAALREPPFEPLRDIDEKYLSYKIAFLLAVTSARRVSELQALCSERPYVTQNPWSAILRINPAFCPKTASESALKGTLQFQCFPSKVKNAQDHELRKLCPVRAIKIYLERSARYRKDKQFLVAFGKRSRGQAVSKQTISRWVSETIRLSYEKMGRDPPVHTNVHSTRGVAASWAEIAQAGLPAICEAGTWSSSQTFARFYRLDFAGTNVANRILETAGRP